MVVESDDTGAVSLEDPNAVGHEEGEEEAEEIDVAVENVD